MRYLIHGACLALIVSATFGCGGSDAPDGGAVAANNEPALDGGGQEGGSAGNEGASGGESAAAGMPGETMPGEDASGGSGLAHPTGDGGSTGREGESSGLDTGSGADAAGGAGLPPGPAGVSGGAGPSGPAGVSGGPGYPGASGPGGGAPGGPPSLDGGTGGYPGGAADLDGGAAPGSDTGIPGGPGYPGSSRSGRGAGVAGVGEAGTGEAGVGNAGVGDTGAGDTGSGESASAPTTLDGFAKQAFQAGRERDAIQFLNAWALSSDAGAAEVLSGIQWVGGLRRPTMAVRWGVGVQLAAPPGFTGDAKPIGSEQVFRTARTRPGGDAGGGDRGGQLGSGPGFGDGGSGGGDNAVSQFAGEFGSSILQQFQSRVASGKFGKALQNAGSISPDASGGGGDGLAGGGGPAGAGYPGAAGGGLSLGGPSGPGGLAGVGGGRGMRGGSGAEGAAGGFGDSAGGVLSTGLTMLGIGTDKELREKAQEARVDVLAIFRVKIKVNAAEYVNNDVEIVLLDPAKGKELYNSASLNNIKVQKAREQSKEDGVEREVKRLFEFIDKDLTVTSMPAMLTAEIVKNSRVAGQLLAGDIKDPLAVMTEIRFYQRNKLLEDADVAAAFTKVAGEQDGKTLLQGSEEERKKVVEKWLPKG